METIKIWIKTLLNKLNQKDKLYHILVNFIIVVFLGVLINPSIGLATAIIISLLKETYDEYRIDGTGWNWNDILADLVGILGLIIIL